MPSQQLYTVRAGDTLAEIADKLDVKGGYQAIAKLNKLANPSQIQPGLELKIPSDDNEAKGGAAVDYPGGGQALANADALTGAPAKELQRGATGSAVKQLQRALVKLGHLSEAEYRTGPGIYGPRTEEAVREFQAKHDVSATGTYGPRTRAALSRALATESAPGAPASAGGEAAGSAGEQAATATTELPSQDLKPGARGAAVKLLQRALIKLGHLSEADYRTGPGIFGPRTTEALREFQAAHDVKTSGEYGPRTRAALAKALGGAQGPTSGKKPKDERKEEKPKEEGGDGAGEKAETGKGLPNTKGKSVAERYALYAAYVERFGNEQAKKDLAAGRRVIVSLRVDTPMTKDRAYRGTYDDRMVTLWRDQSGPHVQEFAANTEPNRRWSIPANQSSKPVGRLANNQTVRYHKAWSSRFGSHLQPAGSPYAQRDEDRDYRFEAGEKKYTGAWGGQAMFIHKAYNGDTGSQGCQTMDPGRFEQFWDSLGKQDAVSYVLVNVTKKD